MDFYKVTATTEVWIRIDFRGTAKGCDVVNWAETDKSRGPLCLENAAAYPLLFSVSVHLLIDVYKMQDSESANSAMCSEK